jgi:hypothetical protein
MVNNQELVGVVLNGKGNVAYKRQEVKIGTIYLDPASAKSLVEVEKFGEYEKKQATPPANTQVNDNKAATAAASQGAGQVGSGGNEDLIKKLDESFTAAELKEKAALYGISTLFKNKKQLITNIIESGKANLFLNSEADERAKAYSAINDKYTQEELADKAKELDVEAKFDATKDELINALIDAGKAPLLV